MPRSFNGRRGRPDDNPADENPAAKLSAVLGFEDSYRTAPGADSDFNDVFIAVGPSESDSEFIDALVEELGADVLMM